MSIKDFKVTDVTYHRNGICGRQFYSVRFSFDNDERIMDNMLAVVPHAACKSGDGAECFVIDMNNPTSYWRGDDFNDQICAAVAEYEEGGPARFKAAMEGFRAALKRPT